MTKEADKLEKLCEIDRLKRSFSDDEIDFTIAENQNKYISDSLEVIEHISNIKTRLHLY